MRVILSLAVKYAAFVVMLIIASCAIVDWPKRDCGTITGVTLSVVRGHPGALAGRPVAGYKAPEPAIASGEKVFWLHVGGDKGKRLFAANSDDEGKFKIELPPGEYFAEPASMHPELRRLSLQQRDDEETLINILFPQWRLQGKPDVKVEKGQYYKFDVEARALYVD
jgi:hypothetical protein